jgi:hypothetical protein
MLSESGDVFCSASTNPSLNSLLQLRSRLPYTCCGRRQTGFETRHRPFRTVTVCKFNSGTLRPSDKRCGTLLLLHPAPSLSVHTSSYYELSSRDRTPLQHFDQRCLPLLRLPKSDLPVGTVLGRSQRLPTFVQGSYRPTSSSYRRSLPTTFATSVLEIQSRELFFPIKTSC